MPTLSTITMQGEEEQFEYVIGEEDHERFIVFVYSIPRSEMRFYQHTFKKVNASLLRSTTMDVNGNREFRQMGIPEAMINEICTTMNMPIESSSKVPDGDDFMINASVAAWRRLVNQFPERCEELAERFLIRP